MRRYVVNEVEERRVIRLFADLADRVPALGDDEVDALMTSASASAVRPRRPRWFQSSGRYLPAIAAAAVVAIGISVQLDRPGSGPSSAVRSGSAEIVTFPEGNALQLLIAAEQRGKA